MSTKFKFAIILEDKERRTKDYMRVPDIDALDGLKEFLDQEAIVFDYEEVQGQKSFFKVVCIEEDVNCPKIDKILDRLRAMPTVSANPISVLPKNKFPSIKKAFN